MAADTFACISQYVALATGDCDVLADGAVVGCLGSAASRRVWRGLPSYALSLPDCQSSFWLGCCRCQRKRNSGLRPSSRSPRIHDFWRI